MVILWLAYCTFRPLATTICQISRLCQCVINRLDTGCQCCINTLSNGLLVVRIILLGRNPGMLQTYVHEWSDVVTVSKHMEFPACTCYNVHHCFVYICEVTFSLHSVLSADRVEQMTKTYNDIEVVTHLLAEVANAALALVCSVLEIVSRHFIEPGVLCSAGQRDRDLELAARIGQSLLQRNHLLQERNEALDEQLAQALDQVDVWFDIENSLQCEFIVFV